MKKYIGAALFSICFIVFFALNFFFPLLFIGTKSDFDFGPIIFLLAAPVIVLIISIFHIIFIRYFLKKWRFSLYILPSGIIFLMFLSKIKEFWIGWMSIPIGMTIALWVLFSDLKCLDIKYNNIAKRAFIFFEAVFLSVIFLPIIDWESIPQLISIFFIGAVSVYISFLIFSEKLRIRDLIIGICLSFLAYTIGIFIYRRSITDLFVFLFFIETPVIFFIILGIAIADKISGLFFRLKNTSFIAAVIDFFEGHWRKVIILLVILVIISPFVYIAVRTDLFPNIAREIRNRISDMARFSKQSIGERVWVGRTYQGGMQCMSEPILIGDPVTGKVIEGKNSVDPQQDLEDKEVKFYDSERTQLPVCEACSCPAYSFVQFFLINEPDLVIVRSLGYKIAQNNNLSLGSLKEIEPCNLPAVSRGGCESINPGFVFDQGANKCVKTELSGCEQYFPFTTIEDCRYQCE